MVTNLFLTAVNMCLLGCKEKEANNYYDTTVPVFYGDDADIFKVGDNNNGAPKYGAEMDRLTSVTPSARQLRFLELEYYNFIHFGMNTAMGNEWGKGKDSPSRFNPKKLDTDQWCEALRASGSKAILLTAKHHDGFCLWPTKTTEYSIKNSPYKGGKGDIVKELAESCKKFGLKFGIYVSPWDRNAETYGHNSYNDFFIRQLTELCTGYGELFTVWFDGARGQDAILDTDFQYDWERIYAKVRELQPNAVINITGPDVRWVGNEGGVARDSEWCLSGGGLDPDKVAELSQKNPGMAGKLQKITFDSEDLGSRDVLAAYNNISFYPAEADVSIRRGWFYHWNQSPKPLEKLVKIYYKTVGANCSMLLNVPPNKDGLIADKDVAVLKAFGDKIASDKAAPLSYTATVGNITDGLRRDGALSAICLKNTESYTLADKDTILDLQLTKKQKVSMVSVCEDLTQSERIEKYDIYAKVEGGWMLLSNSTNVGNQRTAVIAPKNQVETDVIRVVIRQSRKNPVIRSIQLYRSKL